jgi:LmbE family N-acetylglucosaminyl deacetylase
VSRRLVLAPHLDDAVLSWGALVASASEGGADVVVATVFAGTPTALPPAARAFHRECGLPDAEALSTRRAEDAAACEALGVTARHLPFLDALYRRVGGAWLAADPADVLVARAAAEPELVVEVAECIGELVAALAPDVITACAALSPHVDHEILRLAALRACGERVELAEDAPVVGQDRADWAPPPGWVRHAVAVSAGDRRRQLDAIGLYPSQVRMLWPGADYRRELARRWAAAGDERVIGVWRAPAR